MIERDFCWIPARWGVDHLGREDRDRGLREMCNFAALRFNRGECDVVLFKCMPNEVDFIRAHMAEAHPGVKYAINAPHSKFTANEQGKQDEGQIL